MSSTEEEFFRKAREAEQAERESRRVTKPRPPFPTVRVILYCVFAVIFLVVFLRVIPHGPKTMTMEEVTQQRKEELDRKLSVQESRTAAAMKEEARYHLTESEAKSRLEGYLKAWCFGKKYYGAKHIINVSEIGVSPPVSYRITLADESGRTWKIKTVIEFKTNGGTVKSVPMDFEVSQDNDYEITIHCSDRIQ